MLTSIDTKILCLIGVLNYGKAEVLWQEPFFRKTSGTNLKASVIVYGHSGIPLYLFCWLPESFRSALHNKLLRHKTYYVLDMWACLFQNFVIC
jgi:hypothetical protein